MEIQLTHKWMTHEQLGSGGFGKVYAAESELGTDYVVKLVPRTEGASREQLFVDIDGAFNTIPVVESGKTDTDWVLVMPRADMSLRQRINDSAVSVDDSVKIIKDTAAALVSIDGKVVHRDIKPENILLYKGSWCLADFGISRYAEASTAPDTQKYAWSEPYAGPERWRAEHADIKTDVYSLGIVGYELLTGKRPFEGPAREDYRQQHLHSTPPNMDGIKPQLADLIDECLYKPTATRPQPANLLARLEKFENSPSAISIPQLQQANRHQVERISEQAAEQSKAKTHYEQREALFQNANDQLVRLSNILADTVIENAPTATITNRVNSSWLLRLGEAKMQFSPITHNIIPEWDGVEPSFDVAAYADISVTSSRDQFGYKGRSHSLWFCNATSSDEYGWHEVAFMISPFIQKRYSIDPFTLPPGRDSGVALSNITGSHQVAVPLKRISSENSHQFIEWWAMYLAASSENGCRMPTTMPEPPSNNGWR